MCSCIFPPSDAFRSCAASTTHSSPAGIFCSGTRRHSQTCSSARGGKPVNGHGHESLELFFQEASENLQYLREYSGMLQEPQTKHEDLEELYIAAHTLAGTSASYGYPQFSEVASKAAHVFHYAMNATLTPDMHGPLTEFISDAISVLEFDLLQMSAGGTETAEDIAAFKQRYAFAFPVSPAPQPASDIAAVD